AVVHERRDERGELVVRLLLRLCGLGQGGAELVQIADEREGEQLLRAGEVPVDDRAVDADGPGDVLDLRLGHTALVEQRAGRGQDRRLASTTARGRRRTPSLGLVDPR